MKKFIAILLTFILALALTACGEEKVITRDGEGETGAEGNGVKPFVFVYNDVEIPVLAEAKDVMAKLPEPSSKYEAPSCAFGELDTTYTYPGIEVGTYQEKGVEYISYVLLKDDSVETPEGLFIGADAAKATDLYGEPTSKTDNSYTYLTSNMKLIIFIEDNAVSNIQYFNIVLD